MSNAMTQASPFGRELEFTRARGAAPRPTRAVTPFSERKVASTRDLRLHTNGIYFAAPVPRTP